MKTLPLIIITQFLSLASLFGVGFTEGDVVFYGEVRQVGGAQTTLLQSGHLEMTFVNPSNPANRVTLETELHPVGVGEAKPYSYMLEVPLAYLPEQDRIGEFLAIGGSETDFQLESITIDGTPATLPDGSREFYGLSFANRGDQYRLDLLVVGDSTDTDGDGLPDWYEELYGLDPNLADAGADFDEDGWSNLEEFLRGSNPALSNINPTLATAEVVVPELGEAGCLLEFHDSDTPSEGVHLVVDDAQAAGFEVCWDGTPMSAGTPVTAADLAAGRLTLRHTDPAVRETSLPLSWTDGGDAVSGSVVVRVSSPSTEDGNDAALWLEAGSLPDPGQPVATWSDRSGNSRDAMQAVAENQPMVVSHGARRSLDFRNPTHHLFFQDPALPAGDHTLLVAYQSEGTPRTPQVLMSSNRGFLRLDPTAEAISYPGAPRYQIDGVAVRGHESTVQTNATSIFRRAGTSLENIYGLSFNGEAAPAESLAPVLPTLGARRMALPVPDPIQDGFRGRLHELLVYPTALPEQKLRDVHDYLESKWGGAVIWDLSTNLRPVTLTAAGPGRHIIRGGHGEDSLRGGSLDNTISGGPGDDTLRGAPGRDHFVFGGVDTGRDVLIDFDLALDVIDFSALFWGQTGDARQFLTTRLETNFDGPIPTLDTILVLQRPDATVQEIVLRNIILGEPQLVELIVEGRIRMGALSIPTVVEMALAPGSEDGPVLPEDPAESFTVEITRSGDGTAGALEVPIGLFQDALGHDLVVEGSESAEGQRAVVRFDRGQLSKLVTFRPLLDLEAEGVERWETAILPHFRYAISGGPAARSVSDGPIVTLAVIEPDAILDTGQAAVVRVTRAGNMTGSLEVDLDLEGNAVEGLHLNPVPRQVVIPGGLASVDLPVTLHPGWDGSQPRMALLRLQTGTGYQVGSPHEATVYASGTAAEAGNSGFDRWVSAATGGETDSFHALLQAEGSKRVADYLRAYAHGDDSPGTSPQPGLSIRFVDQRPELTARLQTALPDLGWQVLGSANGSDWTDVGATFSEEPTGSGMRFLGPPRILAEPAQLYRLRFNLTSTASGLGAGLSSLTGSSSYGIRGPSAWRTDPATGTLSTPRIMSGLLTRLIVEVNTPTLLDFEMGVKDGEGLDSFAFYLDGVRIAQTSGPTVVVNRVVDPVDTSILMWEFLPASGTAFITNRP